MCRRVELLHKLKRRNIPRRGKPIQAELAAITVNFFVSGLVEFDLVAVFEVRDVAPRRVAHLVALMLRDAQLRRPLLELDGIDAGMFGSSNELFGDLQAAIVVDANFSNDVSGVPLTH